MGMDGAEASRGGAKVIALDQDAVARARLDFHRSYPSRSAKRAFHFVQLIVLAGLAGALAWQIHVSQTSTFQWLYIAALCAFSLMVLWRLAAAASLELQLSRLAAPTHWPTYTILCPLYREAEIVAALVEALSALDYPREALDIKLVVEADDPDTLRSATSAASGKPHIEVISVPPANPRTKPKALACALPLARGDYVVVYDAEDRPHPQQLRAALAAFEDGGERLACVQAPLSIDNAEASWIARQFAAEYAIQFHEILPLLARLGWPMPLGGSSNHFRIDALRAVGGWDPYNVTEDADLGYRLARDGWRADVISTPTLEEAPITFGAWLEQRTRWIKGHMQTWLVLMRNPIRTIAEMGTVQFLAMQLVLGGGLAAACVHAPIAFTVLVAALSPFNLHPLDFTLAVSGYAAATFTAFTASALTGRLTHARAALTMPLYWPLQSIAAVRALFGLIVRPHYWAKTAHGLSPRDHHAQFRKGAESQ